MTARASGMEAAMFPAPKPAPTHAYLGIFDGISEVAIIDDTAAATSECVAGIIRRGGIVERVTFDIARRALWQPWPIKPIPAPPIDVAPALLAALRHRVEQAEHAMRYFEDHHPADDFLRDTALHDIAAARAVIAQAEGR